MHCDLPGTPNNLHSMNFQPLLIWKAFLSIVTSEPAYEPGEQLKARVSRTCSMLYMMSDFK